MKTMTCRELGGECDKEFTTATSGEMVEAMTDHVMENHPDTAEKMEELHEKDPDAWGREFKKKWDATPDDDSDSVGGTEELQADFGSEEEEESDEVV